MQNQYIQQNNYLWKCTRDAKWEVHYGFRCIAFNANHCLLQFHFFYKQLNVQSIYLKHTKRPSANTDGNVTSYIVQHKTDFDAINITAEKDSKGNVHICRFKMPIIIGHDTASHVAVQSKSWTLSSKEKIQNFCIYGKSMWDRVSIEVYPSGTLKIPFNITLFI